VTQHRDIPEASSLEAWAASGDWPAFFAAVRRGGEALADDVAALNAAYRLARTSAREDVVPGFRDVTVAILRNATLEPWLPYLFSALVARGLIPRFWLGDYATYEAYLTGANPGWQQAGADVTLIHLDAEELVGEGAYAAEPDVRLAVGDRLDALMDLLPGDHGPVVLCTLPASPQGFREASGSQLTSSWTNVKRALGLRMVERFQHERGVFVFDLAACAERFGTARARDARSYVAAHVPFSAAFMPVAARALADVVAPLFVAPRKCVVVDGDNTLWGGVLGEEGPEGVKLGSEYPGVLFRRFQLYLKALQSQGTLLALNSKNNRADVLDFMASSPGMALHEEDFAATRINWEDKATNLREIAAELNIGLDSVVFVDDSEVECELIRSLMPEVRVEVFPADPLEIPAFIERFPEVDVLTVTDEDRHRTASIRANVERERLRTETTDLDSFIRSLGIRLTVRAQPADLIPRIAQLTQKTNQFNLTTRRYTEEEIRALMGKGTIFTLGMADRFSDYGTVGLAIVRTEGPAAELDTLLLSCRAFGREVELAFLDRVLHALAGRGVETVRGSYAPTAKNAMVADFYERCGFVRSGADGDAVEFTLALGDLESVADLSRYEIDMEETE